MRVAVFTLTWNRLGYTKKMLRQMQNSGVNYDHYIVDNGSTDGTTRYLRKLFADSKYRLKGVILNKENRGILEGTKQLKETLKAYDVIVKFDNDGFIREKRWLERMLEVCKKLNNKCLINPYIHGVENNVEPTSDQYEVQGEQVEDALWLGGICLLMPKDVFMEMQVTGGEEYKHVLDDSHYCALARQRGYKLIRMCGLNIDHIDGSHGQYDVFPEYCKQRDIARKEKYEN